MRSGIIVFMPNVRVGLLEKYTLRIKEWDALRLYRLTELHCCANKNLSAEIYTFYEVYFPILLLAE